MKTKQFAGTERTRESPERGEKITRRTGETSETGRMEEKTGMSSINPLYFDGFSHKGWDCPLCIMLIYCFWCGSHRGQR